jgi:hypothetical protein
VCDVTKDEAVSLSHRYRAHLDHAERIENGRLTPVQVEVADAYGPTVAEAIRALDTRLRADPKGRRFRTSVISDPAVRAPAVPPAAVHRRSARRPRTPRDWSGVPHGPRDPRGGHAGLHARAPGQPVVL